MPEVSKIGFHAEAIRLHRGGKRVLGEIRQPLISHPPEMLRPEHQQAALEVRRGLMDNPGLKKERYVLYSLLVDEMVKKTLDKRNERPPFGLVHWSKASFLPAEIDILDYASPLMGEPEYEDLSGNKPFDDMTFGMITTLCGDISETLDELRHRSDNYDTDVIVRVFERFREIEMNISVGRWDGKQIPDFFMGGFTNTAILMPQLLRILPELCRRDLEREVYPQELVQVAKASHSFLAQLCMMNIHQFIALSFGIRTPRIGADVRIGNFSPLLPEHFVIKQDDGENRIDFADHIKDDTGGIRARLNGTLSKDVAGCPAMVRFDGQPSAMKQLWGWCIDMAEYIYQRDHVGE